MPKQVYVDTLQKYAWGVGALGAILVGVAFYYHSKVAFCLGVFLMFSSFCIDWLLRLIIEETRQEWIDVITGRDREE